jgi:hypothetical protein
VKVKQRGLAKDVWEEINKIELRAWRTKAHPGAPLACLNNDEQAPKV